jgi:xylose isomerase
MRHFDAHALRTEDEAGVWAFARGCMRTYLILKEKVARFNADSEIQAAIKHYKVQDATLEALVKTYSKDNAGKLKAHAFDREALGKRGPGLEHLDQLTMELLYGVR